ncbi:nickel/cobalt efflux protein RcnA, partial [Klebsiella pneumoniae]|nr:nickel/cobalt efflux protein RcnA [Klebsiella pneumoniae]
PRALLRGALHGLEPGHANTMLAAGLVAVRGPVQQAVLLGLAAPVSHTAVVCLIALAGLRFRRGWNAHTSEPWIQLVSGIVIV